MFPMLDISLFDFHLPQELIAQYPPETRGQSRMMLLEHEGTRRRILPFTEIEKVLLPGDCLVLNNSRVIPARLYGKRRGSGGKIEILLLEPVDKEKHIWKAFVRPARSLKRGHIIATAPYFNCEFIARDAETCLLQLQHPNPYQAMQRYGKIPLPPYIERDPTPEDVIRYQTVYAQPPGSVAAPTAGLHFTEELLQRIQEKGVHICSLTLHVGAGTFRPVKVSNIAEHKMHREYFSVPEETAEQINTVREQKGRIIAVGTTTVRALESICDDQRRIRPGSGYTDIFLHPPYKIRSVDGLLTNFHLPRSTLLMLVSCMVPRETLLEAYQEAINNQMRFFSYGDCMLIL